MNTPQELTQYMSKAIDRLLENALRSAFSGPREAAFLVRFAASAKGAANVRKQYEEKGTHIPPFLIASITTTCNLFCKGCYARANNACGQSLDNPPLTDERWGSLFREAQELGISFILLAGGEPLMRKDVIEQAARVKKVLFPLFTNGTMIDDAFVDFLHGNRNILPILSIEGDEVHTDERRGKGTYEALQNAMGRLTSKGIYFGTSITVTTQNIDAVTGADFVRDLSKRGCKLIFFIEYVPVTAESAHLAPTDRERALLEEKQQELRGLFEDMLFLSFPGDEQALGGCLAAGRGFFHINASGGAEPCPFSPYSDTSLKDNGLLTALHSPLFQNLRSSAVMQSQHSGGCVLFDNQEAVKELMKDR